MEAGTLVPVHRYLLIFTDIPEHHAKHGYNCREADRSHGLIRPCDLMPLDAPRASLTRTVQRGQLEQVSLGLYGLPGRKVSAHGPLAEIARRVLESIVCLLSALRFRGKRSAIPSTPRSLAPTSAFRQQALSSKAASE